MSITENEVIRNEEIVNVIQSSDLLVIQLSVCVYMSSKTKKWYFFLHAPIVDNESPLK